MKNIYLLTLLIALTSTTFSFSQIKAVSETGDQVLLFENGTWEYVNTKDLEAKEIPLNPTNFTKPKEADFLLKSTKINVGFWLNSKKWKFHKAVNNEEAEYEMQLKGGDLYGMILTEKIEMPITTLKKVVLENAKGVAPDIKIIKEEYRVVNGIKVLLLQLNGTMQGLKFSYYGYYYSFEGGTVQFITYTAQNLLEDYVPEIEKLLNGFVKL